MEIANSIIDTFKNSLNILTWPLGIFMLILVSLPKYIYTINKFLNNTDLIKNYKSKVTEEIRDIYSYNCKYTIKNKDHVDI